MVDFLKTLLLSPIELPYLDLFIATWALVAMAFVIAWIVAFFHAQYVESWRALLTTRSRVRVSWAWGWCAAAFLLMVYVAQLTVRSRIPSLHAGLPYILGAFLAVAFGLWLRHSVRSEVRKFQKLCQER